MWPLEHVSNSTYSHHYILGVGIIGERAVIKHDLVEHLGADLGDLWAVVAQVLVFGDHRLAQWDGRLARSLLLVYTESTEQQLCCCKTIYRESFQTKTSMIQHHDEASLSTVHFSCFLKDFFSHRVASSHADSFDLSRYWVSSLFLPQLLSTEEKPTICMDRCRQE